MSTTGNSRTELQTWPAFKSVKHDPILGRKEMSPEQTLVEFISTSASFHGVKSQSLRSLEWDLLKVFPNNIMPANAAAWYMAKRKFYANQPLDLQLLAFLLKKYPDKFKLTKFKVEFLESYSKEVARRKMIYLVQFGLNAYFSHKVEEHGVYFFDPQYYEQTEPFHESLRTCVRDFKSRLVPAYFALYKDQFDFKSHSVNLVSIARQPGAKVITNTTGVILSMVNNQYGNIKFGANETAIFCAKALFRDGWQYSGDPLKLPAMQFDAYKLQSGGGHDKGGGGDKDDNPWIAVLVWCGRKPAAKYYSMVSDFSYTPLFQSAKKRQQQQADSVAEGAKLRQPSSSMMIGQVISIKKNGAVVSVRDDSEDKVFVPGWCREVSNRPGLWLTTLTGDCIGLRDLVAYYIDADESMPGYTAVGKNVMVLKEYEETDPTKKRRSRRSVSMSAGAEYEHSEEELKEIETSGVENSDTSDSALSDSELEVTDGELEWLQQDLSEMIEEEGPTAKTHMLFKRVMTALNEARGTKLQIKKKGRKKSGQDSGLESRETTPKAARPPYTPRKDRNTFWRTKAALAALDQYRSSDDEDYNTGDELQSDDESRSSRSRRRRRSKVENSQTSAITISSVATTATETNNRRDSKKLVGGKGDQSSADGGGRRLPYWVRAISLPEEYEPETGVFHPVDRWYKEEKDPDYRVPLSDDEYEECTTEAAQAASADPREEIAADKNKEIVTEPKDQEDVSATEIKADAAEHADVTTPEVTRKRRGARLHSVLETEIPTEEVELLLKEAAEPLPEDLVQGAHRARPADETAAAAFTEAKEAAEKPEEGEKKEGGDEDTTAKVVVVEEKMSDFLRWVKNALNPLEDHKGDATTEEEENKNDFEYVPPSVILDSDLDYDEFDEEQEVLEEGELDGLLADQKLDLQSLLANISCTNYLPIWVPVESVRERKEAAEMAENEKKKAKETIQDKEGGELQQLLSASFSGQETGLTPDMKRMGLASKSGKEESDKTEKDGKNLSKAEKKVTRAKVGSSAVDSEKKSPPKKTVADKGDDASDSVKEAFDSIASESVDSDAKKDAALPVNQSGESAKVRRTSSDAKSPKKSPRIKKRDSGMKSADKAAALEGDSVAAADKSSQDATAKEMNEGEEEEGGAEKPQQCIQN